MSLLLLKTIYVYIYLLGDNETVFSTSFLTYNRRKKHNYEKDCATEKTQGSVNDGKMMAETIKSSDFKKNLSDQLISGHQHCITLVYF